MFDTDSIIKKEPSKKSICVDASCRGNPGPMEYRVVDFETKEIIYNSDIYPLATNIIGEFLAIIYALAWLKKNNIKDKIVYSDCYAAISWAKNKRINTGLEYSDKTKDLFNLIVRAVNWMQQNHYDPETIHKWHTDLWGEIPADFGRK